MDETGSLIVAVSATSSNSWVSCVARYGVTPAVMECPSARPPIGQQPDGNWHNGSASLDWWIWPPDVSNPVNGSYSINGWLFSYDSAFTNYDSPWTTPVPPEVANNPQFVFTKPTSIKAPAKTPFFNDAVWWNEWPLEQNQPAPDISLGQSINIPGIQRCTIWRHGGTKTATSSTPVQHTLQGSVIPRSAAINIGFADGHAEQVKLKDLWTLYWHDNWTPRTNPP